MAAKLTRKEKFAQQRQEALANQGSGEDAPAEEPEPSEGDAGDSGVARRATRLRRAFAVARLCTGRRVAATRSDAARLRCATVGRASMAPMLWADVRLGASHQGVVHSRHHRISISIALLLNHWIRPSKKI